MTAYEVHAFVQLFIHPVCSSSDGAYDGMGVLVADDSSNSTLVMMMPSSTLALRPSVAIDNELIKNQQRTPGNAKALRDQGLLSLKLFA